MAFFQVYFQSWAIGRQVQMNVILPQRSHRQSDEQDGPISYPTLYLLHGASDDHTIWSRRTSIERYATDKGLAVVMPDGELSWYSDMHNGGGRFFTFMSEELPAVCHEFFPAISNERDKTFIAGLSMGGYGAMKIGLRCPEKYSYIASLSGALDLEHMFNRHKSGAEYIFGPRDEAIGGDDDVFAVAKRLMADNSKPKPKIFQWCGTEDFLLNDSRKCYDVLKELGYDVVYHESEGNHSWPYWDMWIQKVIEWLPING